ncbi:Mor transcription activator family protein [compost metagenome]|jgi:Mor family transcriptional regulator
MTTAMADKRHEMLSDIADHVARVIQEHGLAVEVAEQAGAAVVDHLSATWAGSTITIPKDYRWKVTKRDLEILSKFRGNNHHALAVEYGMTENAIYKLLKRVQERKFQRDQQRFDFGDMPTA